MAKREIDGRGCRAAIFAAHFRRKLVYAMSCGGSGCRSIDLEAPLHPSSGKRTERLAELLNWEAREEKEGREAEEEGVKRKVERFQLFERTVKELEDEGGDERKKAEAATNIRRFCRDDAEARTMLAMLGAIPSLVGILESSVSRIPALYALLNLAIGNNLNKAAIVQAGALHKMLTMVHSKEEDEETLEAVVANFLGLSALDANKLVIGSSGAIPVIARALRSSNRTTKQCKQDALRALYNVSIASCNANAIIESRLIPLLLDLLGEPDLADRVLLVLGNLVCTAEGRGAISSAPDSIPLLVDILNWTDSPECQEKAVYLLMVLAHKSCHHRRALSESYVTSSLLELALIGTPLAQKRASRILEILRCQKRKETLVEADDGEEEEDQFGSGVSGVSEPIIRLNSGYGNDDDATREDDEEGMSEEKMAVAKLVEQSLQNNMRRIARRANLPPEFAQSARFQSVTASSTSKSVPF